MYLKNIVSLLVRKYFVASFQELGNGLANTLIERLLRTKMHLPTFLSLIELQTVIFRKQIQTRTSTSNFSKCWRMMDTWQIWSRCLHTSLLSPWDPRPLELKPIISTTTLPSNRLWKRRKIHHVVPGYCSTINNSARQLWISPTAMLAEMREF